MQRGLQLSESLRRIRYGACGILLSSLSVSEVTGSAIDRPNVLFIAIDDPHEWTNLAGDPQYRTVIEKHRCWLPKHDAEAVAEMR